jgi:transmembrane sensor
LLPEIDSATLARFLSGEATAEEKNAIEARIATDSMFREQVATLRGAWERATIPLAKWDSGETLAALRSRMSSAESRRPGRPAVRRRSGARRLYPHSRVPFWITLAAASAAFAYLGVTRDSGRAAFDPASSDQPAMREFTTAPGERANLELGDGSKVVLGPASKLRVATDLSSARVRAITLDGEAYFEVFHDESKPFVVTAANSVTRVLGTSFGVRKYPEDRDVRVVVISGRVAFDEVTTSRTRANDTPRSSAVLLAGDMATLSGTGEGSVHHDVNVSDYLGWKDGRVAFRRVSLAAALPDLARQYDLMLQVDDAQLRQQRFSMSMPSEDADEVLGSIATILDARMSRTGRVVTFTPRRR